MAGRLAKGYHGKRGRPIDANPLHDYNAFMSSLIKKGLRHRTVKHFMLTLHKFKAEVAPASLSSFENYIVRERKTPESIRRQNYMTCNALRKYVRCIGKPELVKCLPPSEEVKLPSSDTKAKYLSPDELSALTGSLPPEMQVLTKLCYHSGLRIAEALQMKPKYFNFKAEPAEISIPVRISKARRAGVIYLSAGAADAIRNFIEGRELDQENYLFVVVPLPVEVRKGTKIRLSKSIEHIEKEISLINMRLRQTKFLKDGSIISTHWFRHSYLKNLEKLGAKPSQIMRYARHADMKTTQRYLTSTEEDLRQFIQQIEV